MYVCKLTSDETVESKTEELDTAIASYREAQAYQLTCGGPGPVADYEIMAIVNEHDGEFVIETQDNL